MLLQIEIGKADRIEVPLERGTIAQQSAEAGDYSHCVALVVTLVFARDEIVDTTSRTKVNSNTSRL